jgi:hypothetical protein
MRKLCNVIVGAALKKIEDGKGIIVRFVIGRRLKFFLFNSLGLVVFLVCVGVGRIIYNL